MTTMNGQSDKIIIGDRALQVKPFNLKTLRHLMPKIEAIGAMGGRLGTADDIDAMIDIIEASLRANDPPVTRAFIEENVDVSMVNDIFEKILAASGFKRLAKGEARSP